MIRWLTTQDSSTRLIKGKSVNEILKENIERQPDDYYIFSITRSPYTRTLSTFKDKILGMRNDPGKQKVFGQRYLGLSHDMSFHEFLLWLDGPLGHVAFGDRHFIPQHCGLGKENGSIATNYTGKVEDLQESLSKISKNINIPISAFPHLNQSSELRYNRPQEAPNLNKPCLEILKREEKALINKIYSRDFLEFNYPVLDASFS